MKIQVVVTQDDIKRGRPCLADRCPVARALNRATKDCDWSITHTTYRNRRTEFCNYIPPKVAAFVRRFDRRKSVWPISFTVTVPFKYWLRCKLGLSNS